MSERDPEISDFFTSFFANRVEASKKPEGYPTNSWNFNAKKSFAASTITFKKAKIIRPFFSL